MSIVQSLRSRDAIEEQNPGPAIVLCEKAADEIERLERVNRGLIEACSSYTKTNERLRAEVEAQAKRIRELEAALAEYACRCQNGFCHGKDGGCGERAREALGRGE